MLSALLNKIFPSFLNVYPFTVHSLILHSDYVMDPWSYFLFKPVLHNWYKKGKCYVLSRLVNYWFLFDGIHYEIAVNANVLGVSYIF